MLRILLYIILVVTLVACGPRHTTDDCEISEIAKDTITMNPVFTDPNGLIFWTADTVKRTNMPLVLLMDSIYRFVRSDEYRSHNMNDNIRLMSNFRKQLCAYYDRHKMGVDTISSYVKADTVVQSANLLWELDADYSTMGMIINNDIKRTRNVFIHYNELMNLLELCNSEEKQTALKSEFEAWDNLETEISEISANLIELGYCGGSGEGPDRTDACIKILDAHIQLYKKEADWVRHVGAFDTRGVYPQLAKELLIKCGQDACEENYSTDYAHGNDHYKKVAIDTKRSISQLAPIIDKWLDARSYWGDLNCNGWSRDLYNLNTGEVLLSLSNILCLY